MPPTFWWHPHKNV